MARKSAKKAARKRANQTPSRRGGARPGSGRKPQEATKLRDDMIAAFERKNVEFLARAFENMVTLANGGYQRVEEEWAADEETGALTLTKRKVSTAEPDRAANQYLVDRVLGCPERSHKHMGPDGGAIPVSIEALFEKAYGCKPPS